MVAEAYKLLEVADQCREYISDSLYMMIADYACHLHEYVHQLDRHVEFWEKNETKAGKGMLELYRKASRDARLAGRKTIAEQAHYRNELFRKNGVKRKTRKLSLVIRIPTGDKRRA